MKRCPLCEFIYEDDQNLCEMDGIALVDDNAALPALGSSEDVRASGNDAIEKPRAKKSRTRQLAALLIGILLLVLNYTNSNQAARTPPKPPPPSESSAPTIATEPAEPPVEEKTPSVVRGPERAVRKSVRPAAVNPARTQVHRAERNPKEKDSRVGGLLKKTGRILSKPFKF